LSFGSSTRASRIPDLRYLTRDRYVEINHADAHDIGISQGTKIILESGKGSIKALAKISRRVARGVLRIDLKPEINKIIGGRICAVRVKLDV
jgi:predicted molibdopterin-dependent oxidoreductase YjgC